MEFYGLRLITGSYQCIHNLHVNMYSCLHVFMSKGVGLMKLSSHLRRTIGVLASFTLVTGCHSNWQPSCTGRWNPHRAIKCQSLTAGHIHPSQSTCWQPGSRGHKWTGLRLPELSGSVTPAHSSHFVTPDKCPNPESLRRRSRFGRFESPTRLL